MHASHGGFVRTDIWREGKWIDLWSVVHFLSGVSFGIGFAIFHLGAIPSVVIVFLLLVGYEMWEAMVKIKETPQNRFMDVVVGMASFLPTFFFFTPLLSGVTYYVTFFFVCGVNVMLAAIGWFASQKALAIEQKFRAELIEQGRKLQARRVVMRERRAQRRERKRERSAAVEAETPLPLV